jgi:phosphoribosylformylglycinamidine (FGAM) synthase PurS component
MRKHPSKKYRITINLRPGINNAGAEAILKMANSNVDLGNSQLYSLTMGKWFMIECAVDFDIDKLCSGLLANLVIEDYKIEELEDGLSI